jgi:hypothetical protein
VTSQSCDLGEGDTQCRGATVADARLDAPFQPGDLAGGNWSKLLSSIGEVDARGAGIVRIGASLHEPGGFDDTNHCRHRLLRE